MSRVLDIERTVSEYKDYYNKVPMEQIDESDKAFVKSKSAIAKIASRQESVAKKVVGHDRAGWQ
jgi:hypothetical protein